MGAGISCNVALSINPKCLFLILEVYALAKAGCRKLTKPSCCITKCAFLTLEVYALEKAGGGKAT